MRDPRGDHKPPAIYRFDNIDDLEAATGGWALDFRQLDRGRLSAEVQQLPSSEAVLSRVRFSRALDQRGYPPSGFITFGFLERGCPGIRWAGRDTTDDVLLSFNGAGGFDCISRPGHHGFTFTITGEQLSGVAESIGINEIDRCLGALISASAIATTNVAHVRNFARALCDLTRAEPSLLGTAWLRNELEFELPRRLLAAAAAPIEFGPISYNSRLLAFSAARDIIRNNIDSPLTVQQLCGRVGVSWRTLDYAFREHAGMTPQAYLKGLRLDEARRHLLAGTEPTVAGCANRCGFWHMGKFAADYRAQFGELPSETLRRSGRRSRSPVSDGHCDEQPISGATRRPS